MGIHNVRIVGESVSADSNAAARFPEELREVIENGGYKDEQIFNVDETGLFWKKMPSRTYLAEKERSQPGYKVSKDRLRLLLGGNASGDFKLKPLLVYRTENPRDLRGCSNSSLTVIWRSNKKAWMKQQIFKDWFKTYFCPVVECYCKNNNLDFKILLLIDNAPGHSISISDFHENVKVLFLPPNTTSLLQPMDQGIISTFKAYYLRRTFSQAVKATTGDGAITLIDFWKRFTIENIGESWLEVTVNNMRVAWRYVLPHRGDDSISSESQVETITGDIVLLGKDLGFDVLNSENVRECIDSHSKDLDDETLVEMDQRHLYEEEEEQVDGDFSEATMKEFSLKELMTIIRKIEDISDFTPFPI
jgi:DDE superfamily endonuclease